MATFKSKLLTTVAIMPLALGGAAGAAFMVSAGVATPSVAACTANPCAAKKVSACNPCNPCAAKKASACNPCNPCAAKKSACGACNPCNPCAAKKASACNPCNPCAAKKSACGACNPCNPCAASACNPCNPCNPCGASAGLGATECYVPRLWNASACNPCNPCAAKKASACNPCNPCAAKKSACGACNPCNPCAAKKASACNPCNPCAAKKASACNPCNPCAAKKSACGACNQCAAKKASACNPCNPCAAKNPCAAGACNPCNPCNPCGASSAAADPDDLNLGPEEVIALYDCLESEMGAQYKGGGHWAVNKWQGFDHFSKHAYPSATHGNRFVVNYTNKIGSAAYGKYGEEPVMPIGTTAAKASFVVDAKGQASVGPLFIMEKMTRGFNAETADWRYAMVMPGGTTVGLTGGAGSAAMTFCHDCHLGAEETDYMFFLPEEVRR